MALHRFPSVALRANGDERARLAPRHETQDATRTLPGEDQDPRRGRERDRARPHPESGTPTASWSAGLVPSSTPHALRVLSTGAATPLAIDIIQDSVPLPGAALDLVDDHRDVDAHELDRICASSFSLQRAVEAPPFRVAVSTRRGNEGAVADLPGAVHEGDASVDQRVCQDAARGTIRPIGLGGTRTMSHRRPSSLCRKASIRPAAMVLFVLPAWKCSFCRKLASTHPYRPPRSGRDPVNDVSPP